MLKSGSGANLTLRHVLVKEVAQNIKKTRNTFKTGR